MIVDDAEGFLRFLDNVGLQLAGLLDIEGQRCTRKSRLKTSLHQSQTKLKPASKQASSKTSSNSDGGNRKKQPLSSKAGQPNRVRGRRKQPPTTNNKHEDGSGEKVESSPTSQAGQGSTGSPRTMEQHAAGMTATHQQHDTHYIESSPLKLHTGTPSQNSTESQLDTQLTLALPEELGVSSISPVTQLSPIDQSIQQFSSSAIHQQQQQHYYTTRTHLDPYHTLHDEFSIVGPHDSNPITDSNSHLLGQQTSDQVQQINHHDMGGTITQQQQHQPPSTLQDGPVTDCYPLHNHLTHPLTHHHHHHNHHQLHHNHQQQHLQPHHHHHHHQQQEPHQHHIVQFNHLDQPWLCSTSHNNPESASQPNEPDTLEHVVSYSPTSHQTLDQVQFSSTLYHPTNSYYSHSSSNEHHLEPFQHLADDFGGVNGGSASSTTTPNMIPTTHSSSPVAQLHGLVSHDQHSQPPQGLHDEQQSHSIRTNLDSVVVNDGVNISYHNQRQPTHQNYQQNQTHHNQTTTHNLSELNHHQHQQDSNYSSHQGVHLNTTASSQNLHHHSQHHQHQHHHHHHQLNHHLSQSHHVMPLINGLEQNGVIIQDINLASASWSSPEDLYSI